MEMDYAKQDVLLFFEKKSTALPLYETFEAELYKRYLNITKKVQKSQITFSNRHVFACVSFAKVKRKAELPDPYIVITLGLSYPLDSERVAVKTEPYPGRWTTHIVIGSLDDLDEELFEWVQQAYNFSDNK